MNKMTAFVDCSKRWFRKNTTNILTLTSVVGIVGVGITSNQATIKYMNTIQKYRSRNFQEPSQEYKIKTAIKCSVVPITIAVGTIFCVVSSNVINKNHQKLLMSAYAALDSKFKAYRQSAVEIFGEDADTKIMTHTAKKVYLHDQSSGALTVNPDETNYPEELFYDVESERYFPSTLPAVLTAQYHLNRNYTMRGYAELNEFYEFLGLDAIDYGDFYGWSYDGDGFGYSWIDFTNKKVNDDGLEFYIIDYTYPPFMF